MPLLSGIGILVVASLLLRRLGLGRAGAWAVWVLATAPIAVRYGAYTRPYALPLFEMLLFAYATHRWLDGRQRRWLVTLVLTAVALPFTRVPEPCVFLGVTAVALAWASWRGRLRWADTWWVIATSLGALFLVGVPMFLLLGSETQGSFFDPSPGGILGRAGRGLHEIATAVVPLLGSSFPWWPLSLARAGGGGRGRRVAAAAVLVAVLLVPAGGAGGVRAGLPPAQPVQLLRAPLPLPRRRTSSCRRTSC